MANANPTHPALTVSPPSKGRTLRERVVKVALLVALGGAMAGVLEGIMVGVFLGADANADMWSRVMLDRALTFGLFGLILGGLVGLVDGLVRSRKKTPAAGV